MIRPDMSFLSEVFNESSSAEKIVASEKMLVGRVNSNAPLYEMTVVCFDVQADRKPNKASKTILFTYKILFYVLIAIETQKSQQNMLAFSFSM